jgi:CspA family cold shock protein
VFLARAKHHLLSPEGGSQDVFVNVSAVEQAGMTTLNEGQRVSFDVVKDPKKGKTNAQNLTRASPQSQPFAGVVL